MKTDIRRIIDAQERANLAIHMTDEYAAGVNLSEKEKMHLCLLAEEAIGMLYAMTDTVDGSIWIEGDEGASRIHLEASAKLDRDQRKDLIAIDSRAQGAAGKSFMGMLGDLILDSLYHLGRSVLWLANESFKNGMVGVNGVVAPMSADELIPVWSLAEYKINLESNEDDASQEALDDLERSIVARLADDVIISVKGKKVEMVIVKRGEKREA